VCLLPADSPEEQPLARLTIRIARIRMRADLSRGLWRAGFDIDRFLLGGGIKIIVVGLQACRIVMIVI
jgi:hypothetical protein